MAERVALSLIDGKISEVPASDTLRGAGGADNFSYHYVLVDTTLTIKQYQTMITPSLELDGSLDIEGCLVML